MTTQTVTEKRTILVIEDDAAMSQLIQLYLEHEGYEAVVAPDGHAGLDLAHSRAPSLIILDMMLPGIDGSEVCRVLRMDSDVPVIVVTARVDEEERLAGLDLGADDYVTKPFSPRELMARVRAVLRRTARELGNEEQQSGMIAAGPYTIDLDARTVQVSGEDLTLTPTEYRLLVMFLQSNRRTLNRMHIIGNAIGYDYDGFDRTVDTHISNLRRKLERATGGERHLKTVYGVGYRFEVA